MPPRPHQAFNASVKHHLSRLVLPKRRVSSYLEGIEAKRGFSSYFCYVCLPPPSPPLHIFLFELGSRVLSENWPGVRSSSHLTTILFSGSSDKGSLKGTALARVVPVVTAAVGFSLWAQWL